MLDYYYTKLVHRDLWHLQMGKIDNLILFKFVRILSGWGKAKDTGKLIENDEGLKSLLSLNKKIFYQFLIR